MKIERQYVVDKTGCRRGCTNRNEPARIVALTLVPAPGQSGQPIILEMPEEQAADLDIDDKVMVIVTDQPPA